MSDYLDLPDSDDPQLVAEFSREERAVYGYLKNRADDPPTMVEVHDFVASELGELHGQTGRRLRELRRWFVIPCERRSGGDPVYSLVGMLPPGKRKPKRQNLSSRLEAELFAAFNNRCAMCGRSPAEDGVRLVIDHKVPVQWGGETVFENLQPLCEFHNHGKQAWVASLDPNAEAIKAAIALPEPQLRIGELLKAMDGEPVPSELIAVVAREENWGDPLRRLRDLRTLGWDIKASRRKEGKRTRSYYTLRSWEPWPPEGPQAAVAAVEAGRRRERRSD
ncbi:MAG TPA: HNH endonuclease [Coriobacteriia bacterium]|nr:MAG: HNH endonuclease [Actinobacteria bacterium 66_15]HAL29241.1 HNH endonuclease [Coriobacteriia bacterium]